MFQGKKAKSNLMATSISFMKERRINGKKKTVDDALRIVNLEKYSKNWRFVSWFWILIPRDSSHAQVGNKIPLNCVCSCAYRRRGVLSKVRPSIQVWNGSLLAFLQDRHRLHSGLTSPFFEKSSIFRILIGLIPGQDRLHFFAFQTIRMLHFDEFSK